MADKGNDHEWAWAVQPTTIGVICIDLFATITMPITVLPLMM